MREPAGPWGDRRRIRIGLLGGSFNPAHAGHLHVAERALAALGLDQVWLLVSPGNPLKPSRGMAPFPARLASARRVADEHGARLPVVGTGVAGFRAWEKDGAPGTCGEPGPPPLHWSPLTLAATVSESLPPARETRRTRSTGRGLARWPSSLAWKP